MTQYYPPPGPFYPPERGPEEDYYEEVDYEYEDDNNATRFGRSPLQLILIVVSCGCLIVLGLLCCVLLGAGLWVLDPGSSLVSTPPPGSDIGLSTEEPAFPDESVVNENSVRLTILDVNRDAALPDVPINEGQELIVVTIELLNQGTEDADFNERDFELLNRLNESATSIPGAIDGALGRGVLPPDTGLEGRLVFEVTAGEPDLLLTWNGGPGTEPRYILLE